MRRDMHKPPTRAMVIACVALIAAIGGTSYAAATLPKGGTAGQVQPNGAAPSVATGTGQVSGLKAANATAGLRQVGQAAGRQQSAQEGVAGKRAGQTPSSGPQVPAAGVAGLAKASASAAGVAGAK
jgi:hypothetical protein